MTEGTKYGVTTTMVEARGDECSSYDLFDKVVLQIYYPEPPSTLFAVIRGRNSISQGTLYTRLIFQSLTTSWSIYLGSIVAVLLFFVLLSFLLRRVGEEEDSYRTLQADPSKERNPELPSSLAHSLES